VPDYSGTILIHNASSFDGVELTLQAALQSEGFFILGTNFAEERGRPDTVIIINSDEALGTAQTVARRLGFRYGVIQYGEGGSADVTVIIGDDLGGALAE
jgi:hypothetical protein